MLEKESEGKEYDSGRTLAIINNTLDHIGSREGDSNAQRSQTIHYTLSK